MKNQHFLGLVWICFALYWILLWIFCRFYDVWYSNIPQQIMDSGYYENGQLSMVGFLVAWGIPLYFLLYFVATVVLFILKKITLKQLLFFTGIPVFVSVLILLAH
jgi:hypothetical protein